MSDYTTADGQKKLMAKSFGMEHINKTIKTSCKSDYGCDPIGNGKFKMVPSGDIVSYEERCRRLKQKR